MNEWKDKEHDKESWNSEVLRHDKKIILQCLRPYPAFHILEFGQDVESKAISLPSDPAATVHVIPQSQHQSHHLPHIILLQQSLKKDNTRTVSITTVITLW